MLCTDRVIAYLLEQYIDPTTSHRIDRSALGGSEVSRGFVRDVQAYHQCIAETCQAVHHTDRPSCQPLHEVIDVVTRCYREPIVESFPSTETCVLCLGAGTDVKWTYGMQTYKMHMDHLRPIMAFWTIRHFHHIVPQMAETWKASRPANIPGTALERRHIRELPTDVVRWMQWTFATALEDVRTAYRIVAVTDGTNK